MIYDKVKFVEGEKFITIEETGGLTEDEMLELIRQLNEDERMNEVPHLSLLLADHFSEAVEDRLGDEGFVLHDELMFVERDLVNMNSVPQTYSIRSLRDGSAHEFKQVWERCMQGSLNAVSYLNMDKQMRSVEKELGPTYVDTCNIAYEGDQAIGVIMPHIEPGTKQEGRIFYFGLVPEARGQKKSLPLYQQGLVLLKDHFGATYSVGATSVHNKPMQRVFEHAGCKLTSRIKLYKRSL
ncbi:GNAT family N-acetyltransferase [Halobacillus locisalis]|uniref:GNAT family N-acetyltransferase n=1 Tax=Halobacillus locisalis TaxID=220753 RepID=A0A838CT00_9BACI|nr:GNAT family N-acetyltransferase [Halobacillus locisalis]MBA2175074.1 GNAT family N-acetyltransferase [Halobacillus locisalis]